MKGYRRLRISLGTRLRIAPAIAEGIGPDTRAVSTAEATAEALAGVELIVAGAPLLGFSLPTDTMVKGLSSETSKGGPAPDYRIRPMRNWPDRAPQRRRGEQPHSRPRSRGRRAARRRPFWANSRRRATARRPSHSGSW